MFSVAAGEICAPQQAEKLVMEVRKLRIFFIY